MGFVSGCVVDCLFYLLVGTLYCLVLWVSLRCFGVGPFRCLPDVLGLGCLYDDCGGLGGLVAFDMVGIASVLLAWLWLYAGLGFIAGMSFAFE